jgi:transcriptional regulator
MNRVEKENLVLKLYRQGKTIREIAQIVHMSFRDISSIIRRETGEAEQKDRIRLSKSAQALRLFEQGYTPVDVAVKLDIDTGEIGRIYKEYWNLKGLYNLLQVYEELKGEISSILKLYQLTKKEGMGPEQVVNLLKIAAELPNLESRYKVIRSNIFALERREESLENRLYQLNRYEEISATRLESLQTEENKRRHTIDQLESSEAYCKINKVVEKKVREILDNKKLIIGMALSALIAAIRNEPDRSLFRYLLNEEMDPSTNLYCHQKLSELAQKYYEQIVNDSIDKVLNSGIFEP